MQLHAIFNVAEAIFWVVVAVVVAVSATLSHPAFRRLGFLAAAVFLAFAITDLIEVKTGAWYRPWWLLGYNAACLAAIVGCYVRYLLVRRALAASDAAQRTARTEPGDKG
jgi:hypothetical protein